MARGGQGLGVYECALPVFGIGRWYNAISPTAPVIEPTANIAVLFVLQYPDDGVSPSEAETISGSAPYADDNAVAVFVVEVVVFDPTLILHASLNPVNDG